MLKYCRVNNLFITSKLLKYKEYTSEVREDYILYNRWKYASSNASSKNRIR